MPRIYESWVIIYQLEPWMSREDCDSVEQDTEFMDMYIRISRTRLQKEIAKAYKSTKRAPEGVESYDVSDGGVSIYTYSSQASIAAMHVIENIPGFQWDYRTEEEWNEEHEECCSH